MRYRTIVADPPWRYGNQRGAAARGHARNHYGTMTVGEIAALRVTDLATPDAHLWLWGVNQLLDQVYSVARAWGFEPLTLLTWCKENVPMMKHLLTLTALAVICRGLWTHDWRTILAGISVAVIWPLISADVTHVCTCSKNARCLNCVERDGLTKKPRA